MIGKPNFETFPKILGETSDKNFVVTVDRLLVTWFCNTVSPIFAKKHNVCHGHGNYWPKDYVFIHI